MRSPKKVISQQPQAGKELEAGGKVNLVVSSGPAPKARPKKQR